MNKYAFIDALRGWAVLGVIATHAATVFRPPAEVFRIAHFGSRGVQLFFIVSSVTLMMSMKSRSAKEDRPVRNFFVRRFCRIAPAYYLATLFYFLTPQAGSLMFHNEVNPSPLGVGTTLAFVNAWWPTTSAAVTPGGWSISVEMCFYLLFPVLFVFCKSIGRTLAFMVASLAIGLIVGWGLSGWRPEGIEINSLHWFAFSIPVNQLAVFAWGILTYHLAFGEESTSRKWLGAAIAAALTVLAVLAAYRISPSYGFAVHTIARAHLLWSIVFSAMTIGLCYWQPSLLVNRAICRLGVLSFSAYLSHFSMVYLATFFVAPDVGVSSVVWFAILVGVVLATALVSSVVFRFVETPGVLVGKRIIKQWDARTATPVVVDV